jgi:hypothetical protein
MNRLPYTLYRTAEVRELDRIAIQQFGIPGIEFADGPRGCVVGDATAFPVSGGRR